ncbi:hypothetical protein EYS14_23135 [Alteromonadaceae bacterium M269]|nr:hypothetical protein EYS14_23135 [Alteromonadaceae bacterium M269]
MPKQIVQTIVLTLTVMAGIQLFGSKYAFHLKFSAMDSLNIERIIVSEKGLRTTIWVDDSNWSSKGTYETKVSTKYQMGEMELKVVFYDGRVLQLSKMQYKAGEANYISEFDGKLSYVKAHWE